MSHILLHLIKSGFRPICICVYMGWGADSHRKIYDPCVARRSAPVDRYVLVLLEKIFQPPFVMSMWRNYIKCMYMVLFPLKNWACKGLNFRLLLKSTHLLYLIVGLRWCPRLSIIGGNRFFECSITSLTHIHTHAHNRPLGLQLSSISAKTM